MFRGSVNSAIQDEQKPLLERMKPVVPRTPIPDDIVNKRVRIVTATGDRLDYIVTHIHEPEGKLKKKRSRHIFISKNDFSKKLGFSNIVSTNDCNYR